MHRPYRVRQTAEIEPHRPRRPRDRCRDDVRCRRASVRSSGRCSGAVDPDTAMSAVSPLPLRPRVYGVALQPCRCRCRSARMRGPRKRRWAQWYDSASLSGLKKPDARSRIQQPKSVHRIATKFASSSYAGDMRCATAFDATIKNGVVPKNQIASVEPYLGDYEGQWNSSVDRRHFRRHQPLQARKPGDASVARRGRTSCACSSTWIARRRS